MTWMLPALLLTGLARAHDRPDPRQGDAAASHGMLSSRAETVGAGRLAVSDRNLVVVGVSYGFTDNLQATATGLLPVYEGAPHTAAIEARQVVARTARATVAVRGAAGVINQPANTRTALVLGAGGLADLDVSSGGGLALHGALSAGTGLGEHLSDVFDISDGMAILGEVGASARVHERLALQAELWLPTTWAGSQGKVSSLQWALLAYGLRFTSRAVSVDAGFVKGLGHGIDIDPYLLGFPYLGATAVFE